MRGLDRSTLANMLIAEGVKSVVVSLRGERPESSGPGDPDSGLGSVEVAA